MFFLHDENPDFYTTPMKIPYLFPLSAGLLLPFSTPAESPPKLDAPIPVFIHGVTKVPSHPNFESETKYIREPNLVVSSKGTVLIAAGPHHVRAKNDRALQDIFLFRSTDGGRSFGAPILLADEGMDSVLPTTLLHDATSGKLFFLYNVIYNDPDRAESKPCRQFVRESADDGVTWTPKREILPGYGGIACFGGANGYQKKHPPSAGRLIVPGRARGGGPNGGFYSDDQGQTWHMLPGDCPGRDEAHGCELPNGDILTLRRQSGYGVHLYRSSDAGSHFAKTPTILPDAWASCNNGMLSLRSPSGEELVVVSAPAGARDVGREAMEQQAQNLQRGKEDSKQLGRSNGTIWISRDGGKTFPKALSVTPPGWAFGYNGLIRLDENTLGVAFEGAPTTGGPGTPGRKGKGDHNTRGSQLGIFLVRIPISLL